MKKTFSLCLIAAVLVPAAAFAKPVELDRVVAVVNKEAITWAELYRAMEFEFSQKGELTHAKMAELFEQNEAEFLDKMIDSKVQLQEGARVGLTVEANEIDEAINNIKKKYGMDDKTFREALKNEHFEYEDYRKRLSDQILMSKVVTKEVRDRIIVGDSEVADYIAKNHIEAGREDGYNLSEIFFRLPATDDQKKAVEQKAAQALKEIRSGTDFSEVATRYSEGPSDLGFIPKSMLSREFLSAVEKLKTGEVSEPFWSEQGLQIIKLQKKVSAKDEASIKDTARRELLEEHFQKDYSAWLKNLKENSYIEIRL